MATVTLGNIKFNWKGPYNNSTAYVVDDVVSSGGSSYVCILASTGNAVSNGTYWQIMSAAGTDGTDVGATLTTQGDILYRDGSGLQRLAKGTAGQVLKMNAGATAPEYGTLSSDFVRLASLTPTSQVLEFSIDGYFTSDYDVYKIFLVGVTADGQKIQARVNQSGSQMSGSSYVYLANYHDLSTGNTPSNSLIHSVNDSQARIGWNDNEANRRGYIELTVYDPLNTNRYKRVLYHSASYQSGYYYHLNGSFAWQGDTNALSGITIKGHSSSYNVSADHVYVYGLKNA
jgi:hypothetical protein